MKNYVQKGDNLTLTAPAAVASGDLVQIGSLIGVANGDADLGEPVILSTCGVFDLPKVAAEALAEGDAVFLDGAGLVTSTDTGTPVGHAVAAAGNPSDTARVRLLG